MSNKITNLVFLLAISSTLLSMPAVAQTAKRNLALRINLPTRAQQVASADLNNDKLPDLIVGRYPEGNDAANISILLGNGNGTFQAERKVNMGHDPASGSRSPFVVDIEVADLNQDGNWDVVVAHDDRDFFVPGRLWTTVLLGSGDGKFSSITSYKFIQDQVDYCAATSLAIGDYDRDGDPDIYLGVGGGGSRGLIYPMVNLGAGIFEVVYPQQLGVPVFDISTADFNGDGNLDVAITSYRGTAILYGRGDFYFSTATELDIPRYEDKLTVGDFNHDGLPDLAVLNGARGEVRTFINSATGFPRLPRVNRLKIFLSKAIINTDVDHDGILDLVVSADELGYVRVLIGRGDGSFGLGPIATTGRFPEGIVAADWNGDGLIDLAVANFDTVPNAQIDILLNADLNP